jgi:hypothetical protein
LSVSEVTRPATGGVGVGLGGRVGVGGGVVVGGNVGIAVGGGGVGENLAASPALVAAACVAAAAARVAAAAASVCAAASASGVGVAGGDFEQASNKTAVTATVTMVMAGAKIERPPVGFRLSMNTSLKTPGK